MKEHVNVELLVCALPRAVNETRPPWSIATTSPSIIVSVGSLSQGGQREKLQNRTVLKMIRTLDAGAISTPKGVQTTLRFDSLALPHL